MIYTITFNPSLDYVMHTPSFKEGKTNRSIREKVYPGGKGFNVSTILTRLEIGNIALGFIAGFTGEYIKQELDTRQIKNDLICLEDGLSRINVKLKGEVETEINGNGPTISEGEYNQLMQQIEKLNQGDALVLAGSIPSSLPSNIYSLILEKVSKKGIICVVDASGELLRKVLMFHPFLIKPNLDELEDLFNCEVKNQEHLIDLMTQLQYMGAKNVIVSLGKDGACLLDEFHHFHYQPAFKGKLINSVGSGDSMIAGFLGSYLKNNNYKEALKFACACGSATAFSEDLATKEEIMQIFGKEKS